MTPGENTKPSDDPWIKINSSCSSRLSMNILSPAEFNFWDHIQVYRVRPGHSLHVSILLLWICKSIISVRLWMRSVCLGSLLRWKSSAAAVRQLSEPGQSHGSVCRGWPVPSAPNTPHSSQLHSCFKASYWCGGLLGATLSSVKA